MTGHPHAFLRTLSGEVLSPPPIWFMRQAGRYLPEYRAVRKEAGSFLDLCYNPELACEVTMQPIRRYDLDAAILFADILLIPDALGLDVWFAQGEGPRLEPVFAPEVLDRLDPANIHDRLSPIYETVERVRSELVPEKALIGFAGAPWTVATYMIAGRGSKDPSALRAFAYEHEDAFNDLIDMLVTTTAAYLIRQVQAGANAVQIFDSWASGLPEPFFRRYCLEPVRRIAEMVKVVVDVPVIAFPRACGPLYEDVAAEPLFAGVSIDTGLPWAWAAKHLSPHGAVQGGLDPLLVVQGGEPMREAARGLLKAFAGKPFIFNLGHGFVPHTPPENVAELVSLIRDHKG
ncbi:uroporphyrinogen decarboxylase [Parvularcula sp. LCG005]|uniref:uroporphyrinogen decarboxylase n=1 Tax=Parvularcula sp. LCG005 TaxID=3078805 RepID=UPI0029430040|nr:uroporphyrinogen decarboxylase [Parvularcula sp. LCG005]WOI53311.1 uroporphyrinogen decarboxylase [Parvularcula sp. LCG005]